MSTPIMQQYKKIKEEYQECLLFFRLGDFYELFYEDAKTAAKILNITLTKRPDKNEHIPMAGVPYHACEYYLSKLVKAGCKIAICEQTNETGKDKIIKREVVQVITSGTILSDTMLESKRNNFLIHLTGNSLKPSIAVFDITTNEFFVEEIEKFDLKSYLEKIDPSEILVDQSWAIQLRDFNCKEKITIIPAIKSYYSNSIIMDFFQLYSDQSIQYLNYENKNAIAGILEYIKHTQKLNKINIKLPRKIDKKEEVDLDLFTRKNLEITKTLQNQFKGSLLSFLDETKTPQGGRRIYKQLTNPTTSIDLLNERFDKINFFIKNKKIRECVINQLKQIPDFERIFSKIILKKATPNQVYQLVIGCNKLYEISNLLNQKMNYHSELFDKILKAIDENAPNVVNPENSYIKKGFDKELDEYKEFYQNVFSKIQDLQVKYQTCTKISNLRIKNTTLGFLVEINNSNKNKLDYSFELLQNLKNVSRYITEELKSINTKLSQSENFIKKREKELLYNFYTEIEKISESIYEYSEYSSNIDVFSNLAQIAQNYGHVQPIMDESNDFQIINGRHPVLEKVFKEKGQIFVPNNCNLDKKIMLMTGPNMAGKSTYLRQQAIICLLAHCGMFVPCEYAKIGIVDQIFSRISTNDDILQGNSTFMIEMIEMSLTINRATFKSLLILDEVGRGTSIDEGVVLAQSILEFLLEKLKARSIFSTHYLILGNIEHPDIQKKTMHINLNPLSFLYKVVNGVASKSYAIEIAKMAGMPKSITERAEQLLQKI